MKPSLFATALVAALTVPGLAAAEPAAVGGANSAGAVEVRFVDVPTGFNYVWQQDKGWKFVGQSPADADRPALVSSAEGYAAGTPLSEFIDATTGFRFVWRQDSGWEFAGKLASRDGEPAQLASLAGDAR